MTKEEAIKYLQQIYPNGGHCWLDEQRIKAIGMAVKALQEEPISNNYSALLPCIYNRTLEERVKYCKYCSAACEGRVREPVSDETMTIRKEWFEHCNKSWYNEGYIDGKYNRKSQFEEPVPEEVDEDESK